MSDVVVEVEIDPAGNVSSAKAVSGHPLLRQAAKMAANRWKFEAAAKSARRTARLQFVFRIAEKKLPPADATPVFMPPYKIEITHNPSIVDDSKSY
jgi:TonB family protein